MKPVLKQIGILGLLLAGGYVCAVLPAGVLRAKASDAPLVVSGQGLKKGETGRVQRVIDGDSFVLEGGLKVELSGVQAPKPAWPQEGYKAWPLADEARTALTDLFRGQIVQLYYGGKTRDRYDRALAQVWIQSPSQAESRGEDESEGGDEDGGGSPIWVQEEMTAKGYARVYAWPTQTQNTAQLLAAETKARAANLGIWNDAATDGYYAVRSPDPNPLAQYVDSVQIVEGIVISTAKVRDMTYLNFGTDYKTDFTAVIGKSAQKYFKKAGYDPLTLTGARVRVRGWIELRNGPMIWLDDPSRLEVLD